MSASGDIAAGMAPVQPRPLYILCAAFSAASVALAGAPALARDVPIDANRLVIYDDSPGSGRVRVNFSARDRASGISKGAGNDTNAISATLRVSWTGQDGGFTVPAGASPARARVGWIRNDERSARYVNRQAGSGNPTGVSSLVIAEGRSIKLVARTRGDETIDLVAEPPLFGVHVELTVVNAAETIRHCTAFLPTDVDIRRLRSGGRRLIARNGVRRDCPGDPLQVAPAPVLPATPAAPHLWFDGSDPNAVAEVLARTSHPETSALFSTARSAVDGALAGLGSASDDRRAFVAKGAGFLQALGQTPPGGSGYASYRDVVVTAIMGIGPRSPFDDVADLLDPPADLLDVLRDSGRLQSMAEAYDFVRGSGVDPGDDAAVRARIENWAEAYMADWNLTGDPFDLFEGHRDNWAIKAASALITTALAMPDHPRASAWLAQGTDWVNESLAAIVRDPGWYAESAHYLNYTLNNLVPAAWHLRHAGGVDWFDDLEPFVDVAFTLRQPDGREPPFEEGVVATFPWDFLAAAYPGRVAEMMWALENSPGDLGAFDNQQNHVVTRFLVRPIDVTPAAPTAAPTQFLDGDTHAVVLRSDWSAYALQVTGITAIDTSSSEFVPSRHHMENPLDLVLHGAGALLLPTASGGPTVTTSPNRAYYLEPSAKNIPLVDGDAPYLLAPLLVTLGDRIDSAAAEGEAHRLLDAATTTVSPFAADVDVERTVAMIGEDYVAVVDRFRGSEAHEYALTWRGRGDGTIRVDTADHFAADYAWPSAGAPAAHLAVDAVAESLLSGTLVPGFYAPTYGSEESLSAVEVSTNAASTTFLSVLRPRREGDAAAVVTPLAVDDGAGVRVSLDTTVDLLLAGEEGDWRSADGFSSNGRFAVLRTESGTTTGLAGIRVRHLRTADGPSIQASKPVTLAATLTPTSAVVTLGADTVGTVRLILDGLSGLAADATVTFDGAALDDRDVRILGDGVRVKVPGPGALVVRSE